MSRQHDVSTVVRSQTLGRREREFLWILLASAGIFRALLAIPHIPNGLFDDAYVTLRYAANLARGLGLVFNPGERVLGTTSPLLTFILAAAGRVAGLDHLETIDVTLGVLASLGTLYYCERALAATRVPSEIKWGYLAALAFLPAFVMNAVSGMETPLVLFLMSLSLYLCAKNQMKALAVVGILLFLSRVDTGIWLLALGLHVFLKKRGQSLRDVALPLVIFLAGVFAWLGFSKLYFGSIIPQSVVGKAVSHGAFVRPDLHYALVSLSAFIPAERFRDWGLLLIAGGFLLMVPPAAQLWSDYPDLRPIIYFFPLYVAAFLFSRAPLFSWYSVPAKWAFYLVGTYALWQVALWAAKIPGLRFKPAWAMALLGACAFALSLYKLRADVAALQPNPSQAISELLKEDLQPEGRIFLEHIGLVGYKTGRYIYDSMGLVTPETTRLRRLYGRAWLAKAAREYEADVVLLYDTDMPSIQSVEDSDAVWFRNAYRHVKDYNTPGLVIKLYFLKNSTCLIPDHPPRVRTRRTFFQRRSPFPSVHGGKPEDPRKMWDPSRR